MSAYKIFSEITNGRDVSLTIKLSTLAQIIDYPCQYDKELLIEKIVEYLKSLNEETLSVLEKDTLEIMK